MADVEVDLESTDPKELMKSGHHAFITKDYANAAAALGKATQLLAQEHGDEHDTLGEVYLQYARALLEVSRDESEPLGDAIPRGDSDEDSSEEDNNAENETEGEGDKKEEGDGEKKEVDEKEEEEKKEDEKKDDEKKDEEKKDEEMKVDEIKDEEKPEKTNGDVAINGDVASGSGLNGEAGSSTENGEPTEESAEKEDAEPSDLQLAWEVLEVAKKIFTARGEPGKELLSQTLVLLGEVSMESENFPDAVKDIEAGLELQRTLYEKTSRKIAETEYKLGILHTTLGNVQDAVKYFEMTIGTLNERIGLLKEKNDESGKREIAEMDELIPEIKEKINDCQTAKDEALKLIMGNIMTNTPKSQPAEEPEPTSGSATKEVKDISHLVKRKRKVEDTPESNDVQPSKKPTP